MSRVGVRSGDTLGPVSGAARPRLRLAPAASLAAVPTPLPPLVHQFHFPPPSPTLLFHSPPPVVGLQRSLLISLPRLEEPLRPHRWAAAAADTITLAVWIALSQAVRPSLKAPSLLPSPNVPSLYHLNHQFFRLLVTSSPRLSSLPASDHSFNYRHSFNCQSFRSSPATSNTFHAFQGPRRAFLIFLEAQSAARNRS